MDRFIRNVLLQENVLASARRFLSLKTSLKYRVCVFSIQYVVLNMDNDIYT